MEKELLRIETVFSRYSELKKENASYVVIEAEKNNSEIRFLAYGCNDEQEAKKHASEIASNNTQPLDKEDAIGYAENPFFSVPQLLLKKEKLVIAYMTITEYPAYTLSLNIIMQDL